MKSTIYYGLIFLILNFAHAQKITVTINNLQEHKAILYSLSGEKVKLIDSVFSNSTVKFNLLTSLIPHCGIYRLSFNNNKWIDFIYDNEDIDIETDFVHILDSLKIITSESNKLYYLFTKLNKQFKTKTELLQLILSHYPKDDDFYKTAQNKFIQLQGDYIDFVNNISQKNPKSFIAKYIKSAQLPIVDFTLPIEKQLEHLKSHALDNVDFSDFQLINSDVFTNKTIEYLTYYRNPQLPKELLEKEFIKAVDTLLNKAKVNHIVYQHITEYLIDGFKKFGFDKVIDYIVENYVIKDDLCLDVKTEGLIKKRIDQAKYLNIGNLVPEITSTDINGNKVELSKIKSEKILVVFYLSTCPHCKELLPLLNELKKSKRGNNLEILAIALDSEKEDWINFVNNHCDLLINVSDLKGWESKSAIDYLIYATPTMFLLDSQRKIIAKPTTYTELINFLQ